jgi:heme-degrading monooxygenase HmoA
VIEVVHEFLVKEEARGQFELAYGPGGAWSNLFARSPGFRGTTVLRDTKDRRRYLTITFWTSAANRSKALAEKRAGYAELQATLDAWTESRTGLGVFRVLAEAAVRPMGGARTNKGGATARGAGREPSGGNCGRSSARG